MSKLRYLLLCVPFCFAGPALAQPVDDACTILASKLTPDLSSQTSYATRYSIYQSIIRDQRFSSYQTAKSTALDVGLSVLDYVDLTLGTHSDDKSWSTNWSKFNSLTFSEASSSNSFTTTANKWNPVLIQAFLQGCPPTAKGFYAQVTNVAQDHGSFTITVHGIGNWDLEGITAVPKDPKFTCGGDSDATNKNPIKKTNTAQINCEKDENKTLALSIASSQDNVGPFNLLSVADDLRVKSNDYNQVVESKLLALSERIADLSGRTDNAKQRLETLVGRMDTISNQMKIVSTPKTIGGINFNGAPPGQCPPGSFLSGVAIGADDHGNTHGSITCAKVQPIE